MHHHTRPSLSLLTTILVIAVAALPLSMASAETFVLDQNGPLYSFEIASQSFELIGDTGIDTGTLALDPSGQLFAAAESGLYRLDAADGSSTLIGPWGDSPTVEALAFDPSGELFMSADGGVYVVDSLTADRTLLSTPTPRAEGLAFAGGRLLAIGVTGQQWALYSVDRITGALTELYPIDLIAPQDGAIVDFISMDTDASRQGLNIFVASFTVIGLPPSASLTLDRLDLLSREIEPVADFTVAPSIPFATGSAGTAPSAATPIDVPTVDLLGLLLFAILLVGAAFGILWTRRP